MRKNRQQLERENRQAEEAVVARGSARMPDEGPSADHVDPKAIRLAREMTDENEGRVGFWGYTFEARSPDAVSELTRAGARAYFDRGAIRANFPKEIVTEVAVVALKLGLEPIGNVARG